MFDPFYLKFLGHNHSLEIGVWKRCELKKGFSVWLVQVVVLNNKKCEKANPQNVTSDPAATRIHHRHMSLLLTYKSIKHFYTCNFIKCSFDFPIPETFISNAQLLLVRFKVTNCNTSLYLPFPYSISYAKDMFFHLTRRERE